MKRKALILVCVVAAGAYAARGLRVGAGVVRWTFTNPAAIE